MMATIRSMITVADAKKVIDEVVNALQVGSGVINKSTCHKFNLSIAKVKR